MKKIVWLVLSVGITSLFSCNSEKEKTPEIIVETIQQSNQIEGNNSDNHQIQQEVILPVFEDENATNFAKKYNDYVVELTDAAGDNQDKLSELTFKAVDLEKEYLKVKENLPEEDQKKLTSFIEALKQSVQ